MKPKLGLKENWKQFTLLVLVNLFVGGMVGLERTVLPLGWNKGIPHRLRDCHFFLYYRF